MRINIESIAIDIDGTEVEVDEGEILTQLLFLAKVMFLLKWDPRLTLEQLPRMCDSLPDSVYWDVLYCRGCKQPVEFNDGTLRAWTFDDFDDGWTCPECSAGDGDKDVPKDRIAVTAEEAATKAASIDDNAADGEEEADGDECPFCGTFRADGDYCEQCGRRESEENEEEDGDDE